MVLGNCFVFPQSSKTKVIIKTIPDNINIFLNNNFIGKGTAAVKLAKGKYEISAKESPIIWDAKTISDSLDITGLEKDTSIIFDFTKVLYLNTAPEDANIYNGDSLIGFTPMFVPLKDDSLMLRKKGYLSKSIMAAPKYSDDIIKLDAISRAKHTNFFSGKAFKILVGSIVVLGAATAYFKLKADDQFSQYENTGEQSLLDQTRKYDLISGITLGALEINFGILMYYFLSD